MNQFWLQISTDCITRNISFFFRFYTTNNNYSNNNYRVIFVYFFTAKTRKVVAHLNTIDNQCCCSVVNEMYGSIYKVITVILIAVIIMKDSPNQTYKILSILNKSNDVNKKTTL